MVQRGGVELSGEDSGEGRPVVLLHGLTATRRYVVMGSTALQRSGHRVIAYDARGHGHSTRAPEPGAYGYPELERDLEAVMDARQLERAVLAGASMGAHTALAFALRQPSRVAGLVVITPAYTEPDDSPARLARWDALSEGLRRGGVDGFVEAYDTEGAPERWRETILTVVRQRLAQHDDLDALADALRVVPRSSPFATVEELASIGAPTTVVASADEADPGHPQAVGELYAGTIPDARLVLDEPGRSPVAWQGSQLSRVIAELAARAPR